MSWWRNHLQIFFGKRLATPVPRKHKRSTSALTRIRYLAAAFIPAVTLRFLVILKDPISVSAGDGNSGFTAIWPHLRECVPHFTRHLNNHQSAQNRLFYRSPVKRYPPGREHLFVAAAAARLRLAQPGGARLPDMMIAQVPFIWPTLQPSLSSRTGSEPLGGLSGRLAKVPRGTSSWP